jgi:MbtH protein
MFDADGLECAVVVNDEEQYSLWPAHRTPPSGWRREGTVGSKQDCIAHIERVWTDMRPKRLRDRMAASN